MKKRWLKTVVVSALSLSVMSAYAADSAEGAPPAPAYGPGPYGQGAYGPGPYGYGPGPYYGHGPGMMRGPGYGYGPGRMRGPGMMRGPGYGGMMGPGMHHGPMQPPGYGPQTEEERQRWIEQRREMHRRYGPGMYGPGPGYRR